MKTYMMEITVSGIGKTNLTKSCKKVFGKNLDIYYVVKDKLTALKCCHLKGKIKMSDNDTFETIHQSIKDEIRSFNNSARIRIAWSEKDAGPIIGTTGGISLKD